MASKPNNTMGIVIRKPKDLGIKVENIGKETCARDNIIGYDIMLFFNLIEGIWLYCDCRRYRRRDL